MQRLSELEQRILSELEEAGHEDVPTMMLTTGTITGDAQDVTKFIAALEALVRRELIRMSTDLTSSNQLRSQSEDDSMVTISALSEHLMFDSGRKLWFDARRLEPPFGEPFPYIICTEAGKEAGLEILRRRGNKWWHDEN